MKNRNLFFYLLGLVIISISIGTMYDAPKGFICLGVGLIALGIVESI